MELIRLSRIGDSPSEFALGNPFGTHLLQSVRTLRDASIASLPKAVSERCPILPSIGFTSTNGYKPTSGRKMFKQE